MRNFIKEFNEIHNNKYIYLECDNINTTSKIKIICPTHGEFEQLAHNHLRGAGCRKCGKIKQGLSKRIKLENFIKQANVIHNNKYDYSLVQFKYNNDIIKIICPTHGMFEQYLSHHYTKQKLGCPQCSYDKRSKDKRLENKEFISKLEEEIIDNYKFDLINYKNFHSKIEITCINHNFKYYQRVQSFLKGHIGCPKCTCISLGELKIKSFLDKNNIQYIQQHKFPKCKYKNMLSFDFYIPHMNVCIEFDGAQHFMQLSRNGSNLDLQMKRDKAKNKFCRDNNIKLIRIPYWESKNIWNILEKNIY